jgi:DNA-binding transcriptional ArsR family regulator
MTSSKEVVSKDTPLAEITLRRYEKPYDMPRRELVKKLCLSVGLLQPGDSRDIIVDILYVLVEAKKERRGLDSEEIQNLVINVRKDHKLQLKGVAPSNIRRQIKRLRDMFLVEKVDNKYRVSEFEDLEVIFNDKIEKYFLDNILARVKDYFSALK